MPALTNNELTELLNDASRSRAEARTLANISRRAQTLFTDGGYAAIQDSPNFYTVVSPEGSRYTVHINADDPTDEVFGNFCTCPCFTSRKTCKHLQAIVLAIEEGAEGDTEQDAYDPYAYRY